MAITGCIILVALVGVAYCQTTYPVVTRNMEIIQNNDVLINIMANAGSICSNGQNYYYTVHNSNNVTTFAVGSTSKEIFASGNATLNNVDCCCDIVAYGYYLNNKYVVEVDFLGRNVRRTLEIDTLAEAGSIVATDCEKGFLYVIGMTRIFQFNLNNAAAQAVIKNISLTANPTCAAFYTDTDDHTHVFLSLESSTKMVTLNLSSCNTSELEFTRTGGIPINLLCITITSGTMYLYGRDLTGVTAQVVVGMSFFIGGKDITFSVDLSTILNTMSGNIGSISAITEYQTGSSIFDATINTIAICINCTAGCMDIPCNSCDNGCGYCAPDTGNCQCDVSTDNICTYDNANIAGQCLGPRINPDASCIVEYPIALRRQGPATTVLGISIQAAVINVGRRVKTGRWPLNAMPNPNTPVVDANGATGPSYSGFQAEVPVEARGRRFGIFYADVTPNDALQYQPVQLCCISTENSGFYNKYYTYTSSRNEAVTMETTFSDKLLKFQPMLRWQHTSTAGVETQIAGCNTQLNCMIANLDETHEGVYQVFRARRYKRTWHPIIYLFVRGCQADACGSGCSTSCPSCEQGLCDETTCTCTCYAGWTGLTCSTPCAQGYIGQECGIKCSDHFTDADCKYLSICRPGKAGCTCYSGLQSPECKDDCTSDFWGPDCRNTCTGPCNARTGP